MINVIGIRVGAPIISSGVLPAPFATAATGVTSTSFTANWNAYSGASFYLLDVSLSNTFSSFVGAYENFVVMSTSQVVSGLTSSTTYYYRVRAAVSVDSDTVSFMTRVYSGGGSLTYTETVATDDLVTNLKSFSLWSKMSALYPMVGGSPASTAQNLKSSSFTGTFNGGWSFANTGITPNGTSGYMNTNFIPSTDYTSSTNFGLFIYTSSTTAGSADRDLGIFTGGATPSLSLTSKDGTSSKADLFDYANRISATGYNVEGFYIGSRTASNSAKLFRNGTSIGSTTGSAGTAPSIFLTLGGANLSTSNPITSVGVYSAKTFSFAGTCDGLTDTEAGNFYACVQGFQTTLSRQIGAPWYNNGNQLLDTYSGAAAAYSLRKLRNTYVGPAIRVRRSSDNAEEDIYFDSTGVLNTSQLYGFCLGTNNGFVTTWYDQSGNGRNATQSTASNQPQIVSSGTIVLSEGYPAINFNPAATLGNNQSLNTTSFGLAQPYNLFMVSRYTSFIGGPANLIDGTSGGDTMDMREVGSNFEIYAGSFLYQGPVGRTTSMTLYNVLFNGSSSTYYNDSNFITSGNVGGATPSGLKIGGYSGGSGGRTAPAMFNELIVYPSNQASNRTGIESNINAYYGIY